MSFCRIDLRTGMVAVQRLHSSKFFFHGHPCLHHYPSRGYCWCQGTSALAVAAPARHHCRWTGVELATYFVGEIVDYHSY